jgi:hypothetical protein
MNEIPSRRPAMCLRKENARVSPLKIIDTTSVSTMAAFIAYRACRCHRDATRATLRRTLPQTRPRATARRSTLRSPLRARCPVGQLAPQKKGTPADARAATSLGGRSFPRVQDSRKRGWQRATNRLHAAPNRLVTQSSSWISASSAFSFACAIACSGRTCALANSSVALLRSGLRRRYTWKIRSPRGCARGREAGRLLSDRRHAAADKLA